MERTAEQVRICNTCYLVLADHSDSRSKQILEMSHNWLRQKVYLLNDEILQRLFLENIVAHRILLRSWIEVQSPDPLF